MGILMALLFHLPNPSSCWGRGCRWRRIVSVVIQHPCTFVGESAAFEFLKKVRERNVLYESDSLSRMGKINGGKTKTNFLWPYVKILLCALRKMLKMMSEEESCSPETVLEEEVLIWKKLSNLIATANGRININKALNTSQISFIFKSKVQDMEVVICVSPADTKLIEIKTRSSRQTLWVKKIMSYTNSLRQFWEKPNNKKWAHIIELGVRHMYQCTSTTVRVVKEAKFRFLWACYLQSCWRKSSPHATLWFHLSYYSIRCRFVSDCKPGSEDGRMSVDGTNTGRHRDKEVHWHLPVRYVFPRTVWWYSEKQLHYPHIS